MIHTGIDVVEIARVSKLLKENEEGFLNRVCLPTEIHGLPGHGGARTKRTEERVAGIFALKEAFAKALGTGIGADFSFHDAEVSYTSKGQPRMAYLGQKFEKAHAWQISCSVSHDAGIVAAVVVIQGDLS